MHVASALTFVRRSPALSDVPGSPSNATPSPSPHPTPVGAEPTRIWARKALPGGILLAVLVLLGALFPMIF